MSQKNVVKTVVEFCKGCRICVEYCPKNVLELDDKNKIVVAAPEKCSGCMQCELRCPDFAITVEKGVDKDD